METELVSKYNSYTNKKILVGIISLVLLLLVAIYSMSVGAMKLSFSDVLEGLFHSGNKINEIIIWNIRIPRTVGAILAGVSLSISGCIMQCTLRNPLASPYTMGISQGAAFGAAFAIIVLGGGETLLNDMPVTFNNPYIVTISAFCGSLIGVFLILLLAKLRELDSRAMILAGMAIGSFFSASTMLLQFFADDVKVASVVFWTFGDIGRVGTKDLLFLLVVTVPGIIYFISKRLDYNIFESGEENAKALGMDVKRIRIIGILFSALMTSISVAFLGIIGFIGLLAPHIVRRVIGGDHRFLIPISAIIGGLLLLVSDTIARTIISPVILPVGILTSFIGVPMFIYILIRKR